MQHGRHANAPPDTHSSPMPPSPPSAPDAIGEVISIFDTPSVHLERSHFLPDLPISTTAVLSGFLEGEEIDLTLVASDGVLTSMGTATANAGGIASLDIRHDGLPAGTYAVIAVGDQGSKDATGFYVK